MAVNLVDLEVLPSVVPETPVLPTLVRPVEADAPAPDLALVPVDPPRAALDRAASYWVRRRREQELVARAMIDETAG